MVGGSGAAVVTFTVGWNTFPGTTNSVTLSCVDTDGLDVSTKFLTSPAAGGAVLSLSASPSTVSDSLAFPYRATAQNRFTEKLITCTATTSAPGYTAATFSFYLGPSLDLSNNVPMAGALANTQYNLVSTISPDFAMQLNANGPEIFTVSCGTDGGMLNGTASIQQSFTDQALSIPQTLVWTAPAIPKALITCTYMGGTTNAFPDYTLFDFYSRSVNITMQIPTITVAAFTGIVTGGTNTPITISLSQAATNLQLTATCKSGGVSIATIPPFTVSGTTATFNIGATLTAAATGVTCTLARSGGDVLYTNSPASNSVGPFTVAAAPPAASSSGSNAGSSSAMPGASSSTGPSGCVGPTCDAPASLRAGMAMVVLAFAAILALMQ